MINASPGSRRSILRIPDMPDRDARDTMEATDVLLKYARDEGGGDSNWNPALHPRAGTPPNPGWFAPTGGSGESFSGRTAQNDDPTRRSDASPTSNDDWVRLRSGPKRIDELADFIEWIANAKPEDAPAIAAEIDRYFKDVGWEAAAKDLKNMLAVLIGRASPKRIGSNISIGSISTLASTRRSISKSSGSHRHCACGR